MIDHYGAEGVARDQYRLRPDARRFENWENNYAARLGLGLAVDYALAIGLAPIAARCHHLSGRLRSALSSVPGIRVLDLGRNPSAIVSFLIDGVAAGEVVAAALQAGITIGQSDPASTRLDAEARSLPPVVRASPHYYNTDDEIERLASLCATLARRN